MFVLISSTTNQLLSIDFLRNVLKTGYICVVVVVVLSISECKYLPLLLTQKYYRWCSFSYMQHTHTAVVIIAPICRHSSWSTNRKDLTQIYPFNFQLQIFIWRILHRMYEYVVYGCILCWNVLDVQCDAVPH